jgi:hypothetical protein
MYLKAETDFIESATKRSWNDLLRAYCEARDAGDNETMAECLAHDSEFEFYYTKLGHASIKANRYVKKALDEMVYANSGQVTVAIYRAVQAHFKSGEFYSAKEVKEFFKGLYAQLSIKATAKGTDLMSYSQSTSVQKRVDGKKTEGFVVKHTAMVSMLD